MLAGAGGLLAKQATSRQDRHKRHHAGTGRSKQQTLCEFHIRIDLTHGSSGIGQNLDVIERRGIAAIGHAFDADFIPRTQSDAGDDAPD